MLEKKLESPLDCKEIQPVHPKGHPSWIFIGRTDAEAEAAIFWSPDVRNWLIGRDPDAGKDWRWEEKGTRGWDGWMASLTHWTWIWPNSGRQWKTEEPGVLQSMGWQIVGHDLATEQQQLNIYIVHFFQSTLENETSLSAGRTDHLGSANSDVFHVVAPCWITYSFF